MFSYLFCRHSTTKYTLYEDFVRDPRAREQSDVYDFGFSNEMYYWVQVVRECTGIKYKGRTGSMRKAETEKHEKKKERIRIKLRIFFFFFFYYYYFYLFIKHSHMLSRSSIFHSMREFRSSFTFYFSQSKLVASHNEMPNQFYSSNFLFLSTMFYEVFYVWKMFLLLGNGFSYRFFDETISNFYPLQHVASHTRSTA